MPRKYKFIEVVGTRIPLVSRAEIPPTIPMQRNFTAAGSINFPAEFDGYALDVIVDNFGAGTATIRFNGGGNQTKRVVAGGAFSAGDQIIVMLELLTGITDCEVTFSYVPLGVKESGRVYGEDLA